MNKLLQNTNIIIINYNGKIITAQCIQSLIKIDFPIENIIISDNASTDNSFEYLKERFSSIKIIQNKENLGYASAINSGAKLADKKYLILSNNDVIYQENSITQLINHLDKYHRTGTAGPQQTYPDGSWQRSSGILPKPENKFKEIFLYSAIKDIFRKINFRLNLNNDYYSDEYIDGAVIAVRKSVFDELNGFDENFFFYSEEADFCYRISQLGLNNVILRKASVIHLRGASSKEIKINDKAIQMLIDSKSRFLNKHFDSDSIKCYVKSVILNHKVYLIFWKIISKIGLVSKFQFKEKEDFFSKSIEIWKTKMDKLN